MLCRFFRVLIAAPLMVDAGVFFIPRISRVLLLTRLILIFNSTSCASLLSASSLLFLSLSLSLFFLRFTWLR